MFNDFGLPEERNQWERLLGIESRAPSDEEIEAILHYLAPRQQWHDSGGRITRLNLREIGTPAFLSHLGQFPDLEDLDVSGVPLGDEDLAQLLPLKKLRKLHIPGARISDAAAEILVALSNLADLNLSNTAITDAGLMRLKGLRQLEQLHVYKANVSDAAVKAFQKACPGCRIYQ